MNIIPFTESYNEALVALWRDCNLIVPWNNPARDIARKLEVGREFFLLGIEGDQLVASVMGGYEGHRGWVNYLAVSPTRRGRGYGRAMMTAVEAALLSAGCPKINLQVRTGNSDVRAFYTALGYSEDEVISFGKRLIED